jgi:hypothetical protein
VVRAEKQKEERRRAGEQDWKRGEMREAKRGEGERRSAGEEESTWMEKLIKLVSMSIR